MNERFTYSIGEVCKYVRCHPDTVKRYEEDGYLGEVRRSKRGHRRYTREQMKKMKQVFDARNR